MKSSTASGWSILCCVFGLALSIGCNSALAENYCSASAGRGFGGVVSYGVGGISSIEIIGASTGRAGARIRASSSYLVGSTWVNSTEELPLFKDGFSSADYTRSRRVGYVWSILWTVWNANSSTTFVYNRNYSVLSDIYNYIQAYETWVPLVGACE